MITEVIQDDLKKIDKKMLNLCLVPKEHYIFFNIEDVLRNGKQIHKNVFLLDNLIFKISENKKKILKVYFPVKYFKNFPNIL